jgi:hypothetical protein
MLVYDHCEEERVYAAAEQALACGAAVALACDDDVMVLV